MYQRSENPCSDDRDRPELNENSTAMATGASDHTMYSMVKTNSSRGFPHGFTTALRHHRATGPRRDRWCRRVGAVQRPRSWRGPALAVRAYR